MDAGVLRYDEVDALSLDGGRIAVISLPHTAGKLHDTISRHATDIVVHGDTPTVHKTEWYVPLGKIESFEAFRGKDFDHAVVQFKGMSIQRKREIFKDLDDAWHHIRGIGNALSAVGFRFFWANFHSPIKHYSLANDASLENASIKYASMFVGAIKFVLLLEGKASGHPICKRIEELSVGMSNGVREYNGKPVSGQEKVIDNVGWITELRRLQII